MFDNLQSQLAEASETDLLEGFENEAADDKKKTVKKTDDKKDDKSKKTASTSKDKPVLGTNKDALTELSDDDDDAAFEKEEEDEKEEDEDTTEDENDNEEEEKDEDEDEKDEDEDEKETDDDEELIKDFISQRAKLLIKNGEWADFDGSDEYEWNEENFAEMELQQRAFQKQQMTNEILEGFGPYGKEIATYAQNGGDPDKLIDIFKEQQRVESLALDSEESQRAIVMKYETEFLNRKPERVKKYIDGLIADKELEAVAKEAKEEMESALTEQTKQLQIEQEAVLNRQKEKQKQDIITFQSKATDEINKIADISADEKKQLLTVLTKFDKKLKNGTPVNEFYSKFEQFRKDMPNYIKLVRFVLNPDKFLKTVENNGKTKATEKAFKLARTASKSGKTKSNAASDSTTVKTKFKLI